MMQPTRQQIMNIHQPLGGAEWAKADSPLLSPNPFCYDATASYWPTASRAPFTDDQEKPSDFELEGLFDGSQYELIDSRQPAVAELFSTETPESHAFEEENAPSVRLEAQTREIEDLTTMLDLENVISFLLTHTTDEESQLLAECCSITKTTWQLESLFSFLISKFKTLHKTKQEMTKYCMRKAFKFIADQSRKYPHTKEVNECLRTYFSKRSNGPLSIPFKKNSAEKTMNGVFLKRVFTSPDFARDFKHFLSMFEKLMEQDNVKKVKYLAHLIFTNRYKLEKVSEIKRLPWTSEILRQTSALACSLLTYADTSQRRKN